MGDKHMDIKLHLQKLFEGRRQEASMFGLIRQMAWDKSHPISVELQGKSYECSEKGRKIKKPKPGS